MPQFDAIEQITMMFFVSGGARQPGNLAASAGWVHVAAQRFVAVAELHWARESTPVQLLLDDVTRAFEASREVEKCFGPAQLSISARKSDDPTLRASLAALSIDAAGSLRLAQTGDFGSYLVRADAVERLGRANDRGAAGRYLGATDWKPALWTVRLEAGERVLLLSSAAERAIAFADRVEAARAPLAEVTERLLRHVPSDVGACVVVVQVEANP